MNHKRSSSIHKIRELKLAAVLLDDEYDVLRLLGKGYYGKVQLAVHKQTGYQVALKSVPKEKTKMKDFLTEFHYSYFLSPHANILISYDVAFQTQTCYVFAQEYAPHGDLSFMMKNSTAIALDEAKVKLIAKQLASALEFMHSKQLVHLDVRPQNVLVFDKECARVKLTDFGLTKKAGTLVKKRDTPSLSYVPPEICEAVYNEGYHVDISSDVWQMAILLYSCLTSSEPWGRADITDSDYTDFFQWQRRKTTKIPSQFKEFTPRLQRLFRRMMERKVEKRTSIKEVFKYLGDKWLIKTDGTSSKEKDSDCSQKSKQSSQDPKDRLGQLLLTYGVDVKVDRESRKKRINDWIVSASTSAST